MELECPLAQKKQHYGKIILDLLAIGKEESWKAKEQLELFKLLQELERAGFRERTKPLAKNRVRWRVLANALCTSGRKEFDDQLDF